MQIGHILFGILCALLAGAGYWLYIDAYRNETPSSNYQKVFGVGISVISSTVLSAMGIYPGSLTTVVDPMEIPLQYWVFFFLGCISLMAWCCILLFFPTSKSK